MSKKLLAGLAPVLAVGAFLMVPMTAQAVPHLYSNNVLIGSEPKQIIGWGTITLALTKPPAVVGTTITCHNAIAGFGRNPTGGAAGGGVVEQFYTYKCESEKNCLLGETTMVLAEGMPSTLPPAPAGAGWPDVLTEEVPGVIRSETTGVKVDIECVKGGKVEKETKFDIGTNEKGQRPKVVKGTSALHPGFVEFGPGSGELEVVGSAETITGKTEGEVKTLGYEEQELINAKNP
jgi:hypothetical protein